MAVAVEVRADIRSHLSAATLVAITLSNKRQGESGRQERKEKYEVVLHVSV